MLSTRWPPSLRSILSQIRKSGKAMRHVILTCKNHPNLRWSTKEIAFSDEGGYNGCRNIFYLGILTVNSALKYSMYVPGEEIPAECPCKGRDLIRAPEDNTTLLFRIKSLFSSVFLIHSTYVTGIT